MFDPLKFLIGKNGSQKRWRIINCKSINKSNFSYRRCFFGLFIMFTYGGKRHINNVIWTERIATKRICHIINFPHRNIREIRKHFGLHVFFWAKKKICWKIASINQNECTAFGNSQYFRIQLFIKAVSTWECKCVFREQKHEQFFGLFLINSLTFWFLQ